MLLDDVYDCKFKHFAVLLSIMHGWVHMNMPTNLHI